MLNIVLLISDSHSLTVTNKLCAVFGGFTINDNRVRHTITVSFCVVNVRQQDQLPGKKRQMYTNLTPHQVIISSLYKVVTPTMTMYLCDPKIRIFQ